MSKKWWMVAAIVVVVVGGLGWYGWQLLSGQQTATAEAQASRETAIVRQDTLAVTVEGSGSLTPRIEIQLAFLSGGQVAEMLIQEGQAVALGQPLIRLETDELALELARSEAALASAEGQLAQLLAPPKPEEVAAQQANLAAAQGQVSAAAANRDQVAAGPSEAQIAQAETQVAQAEMEYRTALRAYDTTDENDRDRKEQARYDLWAAEVALDAAQAQLDVLLTGADADELRAAQSNVAAAAAQRDAAQAQLDLLLAGATGEQIQAAAAAVAQARVAVEQARLNLEWATLEAPMDGTVTALNVGLGERVAPGQPLVVLSDLAALEVDVNLDETDVARVSVGQDAAVSVDAFPDVEISGQVTYIAPKASVSSGVVLYPITVQMAPTDAPDQGLSVRAGMTADVEIVTASQADALIVPLRAVHTEDGLVFVNRLAQGQVERVAVTLGMMNDVEVEIVDGVSAGDVVLVVASADRGGNQGFDDPVGERSPMSRFMGGN